MITKPNKTIFFSSSEKYIFNLSMNKKTQNMQHEVKTIEQIVFNNTVPMIHKLYKMSEIYSECNRNNIRKLYNYIIQLTSYIII